MKFMVEVSTLKSSLGRANKAIKTNKIETNKQTLEEKQWLIIIRLNQMRFRRSSSMLVTVTRAQDLPVKMSPSAFFPRSTEI